MPFILIIFKLCAKYQIQESTIKQLNYHDLIALVYDFQIDEVKRYLNSLKKDNQNEVKELDDEEVTRFLCGKLPKRKEVN